MVDGKGRSCAIADEGTERRPESARGPGRVVCFGGVAVDRKYVAHHAIRTGTSNPATGSWHFGGGRAEYLDTPRAIAGVIRSKRMLGLGGGVLVANPVSEADEIPAGEIGAHVETALAEAAAQGVTGKAVTPFILSRVMPSTSGRSLSTNIALIKNNAALAAQIALQLTCPPAADVAM